MTPASLSRRRTSGRCGRAAAARAWLCLASLGLAAPQRAAPLLASGWLAVAPRAAASQDSPAGDSAPNADVLLARLRAQVTAVEARLDGVLGVYVEDLTSATPVVELRADEVLATASSIKPAVLLELYLQAEEGRLRLDEAARLPLPRVAGSGILKDLGDRVSLTWRDLAVLMLRLSDNEATNLLIRKLGRDAVNRRLDALGLTRTRLRREMMDLEAARRGDENVSTPRELARLAATVARGEGLSSERGRDLVALATLPESGSWLRRGLPEGARAIAKSGTLEGVRCEMAWVELPGRPYSVAIMTGYLKREADAEAAITELAAAIHSTLDRLARSSEYGRVIR